MLSDSFYEPCLFSGNECTVVLCQISNNSTSIIFIFVTLFKIYIPFSLVMVIGVGIIMYLNRAYLCRQMQSARLTHTKNATPQCVL